MKKIIIISAILCGMAAEVLGQASYLKKPTPLETRWAKNVTPTNNYKEYPRPQLIRKNWENLNGLWEYAITGNKANSMVKADGRILVPYPVESALSGVKRPLRPDELLWYRRTLQKPILKPGEKCILNFGAVDWQATIYVNGKEAGTHTGGYTSFSFDITDLLKKGRNELVIKVYDPTDRGIGPHGKQALNPANIYYTSSSGIWQTVWLETVPKDYIESLTITPDIDRSVINVTIHSKTTANVEVTAAGKIIKGKSNMVITLPIKHSRLWSPDDPHLYDLKVTLHKDDVKSYFGMRKISIGKDTKGIDRIMLNNKYTYNLGILDQGFWPGGLYTAPTDEALRFDIEAIKAMGFNTIRKHIKVEPARWYYYADKLGMMVWQDLVNPNQALPEGAKREFERESAEIVKQMHNYPSITSWVLFNENWGQYDQARLTKWLRESDPSRLVNGHSGELLYVNGTLKQPSEKPYIDADLTDVHSYPEPRLPEKQQGKAQVCGEFGGIGVPVVGHQWDDLKSWGYIQVNAGNLENKYADMVKRLKEFELQGLSGSIYTQAFDVECEENGLMTYDRAIIKIPLQKLREINGLLVSQVKKTKQQPIAIARDLEVDSQSYMKLKQKAISSKKDSTLLRHLILLGTGKDSINIINSYIDDYLSLVKDKYDANNLAFLSAVTTSISSHGFRFFLDNVRKIDTVLGADAAEGKIYSLIESDILKPFTTQYPDWKRREAGVEPFGVLGQEVLRQYKLFYAVNHQDSTLLKEIFLDWFKNGGMQRKWINQSDRILNGIAWAVFDNLADKEALEAAKSMAEASIKLHYEPHVLDTYANILYKLGKTDEALKWEEKAIELAPKDDVILNTFEKMKAGQKTWDAPADSK